jgi:DNA-directed RNA polymerase subunit E'/Rpb7
LETQLDLECKDIGVDIDKNLQQSLVNKMSGKCIEIGYIKPNSIKLRKKTIGLVRSAHFNGKVTYKVSYEADVYIPTYNSTVTAKIKANNNAGILAVADPMQIIVAKKGSNLDKYKVDDIIRIKLIQFKFESNYILAVGELVEQVKMVHSLIELSPVGNIEIIPKEGENFMYVDNELMNKVNDELSKIKEDPKWNDSKFDIANYIEIKYKYEWTNDQWVQKSIEGIKYQPLVKDFYVLMEIINALNPFPLDGKNVLSINENGGWVHALSERQEDYKFTVIAKDMHKGYNEIYKDFVTDVQGEYDIITANGGNKNVFEKDNFKTFIEEVLIAIKHQSEGGTFIMKIYDMFTDNTVELINLLRYFYGKVTIITPILADPLDGEKYLVCTEFIRKEMDVEITSYFYTGVELTEDAELITNYNNKLLGDRANAISEIGTLISKMKETNVKDYLTTVKGLEADKLMKLVGLSF